MSKSASTVNEGAAAEDLPYGLTQLQRDTLLIIQELSEGSVAPSILEITHELDHRSKGWIHRVLQELRTRGWITWIPQHQRSIQVLRRIPVPEELEIVGFFEDVRLVEEFLACPAS